MSELKHEFTWKLPAPPARVFAALTDADELKQWFAEHAEVSPELGGAYRFWGRHTYGTPSREEANGRITKFAPSQALAYTWRIHDRDSEVSFVLEGDPDNAEGTVLKGAHSFAEAPAINRAKEMIDDLWRFNWGNFSAHVGAGMGKMLVDYSDPDPNVTLSIYIDAPPSAVFRTLIDPEKIQQWFGVAAAVDPQLGGDWHLKMEFEKDGQKMTAPPMKILEYVENERLAITWPDWRGDKSVPDQRVLWKLKPEGAGTRVDFLHDGFVRAVDVSDYPFGWGWFLSRITAVAEGKTLDASAHPD
ncbi:MAG TPA: SRPBCC family protein [Vitreimonas sp.]|uniref:SRPBCC family protein n=1 Tax=Vitreimonas sp. TaxID=3069702 RepID=UPI002D35D4D2|nr:SRPBCC family protein [Vitreimonas sp.]HYD87034.1 SRPBCC family protein [Vitreimonas sp.]